MAIKNYSSEIPIDRIFQRIQDSLVQHGARQISFDYGGDGKIYGVFFSILLKEKKLQVKLPGSSALLGCDTKSHEYLQGAV